MKYKEFYEKNNDDRVSFIKVNNLYLTKRFVDSLDIYDMDAIVVGRHIQNVRFNERCPFCGGKQLINNGHGKLQDQLIVRLQCKDCIKTFNSRKHLKETNIIIPNIKLGSYFFNKFITQFLRLEYERYIKRIIRNHNNKFDNKMDNVKDMCLTMTDICGSFNISRKTGVAWGNMIKQKLKYLYELYGGIDEYWWENFIECANKGYHFRTSNSDEKIKFDFSILWAISLVEYKII